MSRIKTYICATIFIAVTAVKLIFPSAAQELREFILPRVSRNADYRAVMVNIGESIVSDSTVVSALGWLIKDSGEPQAEEKSESGSKSDAELQEIKKHQMQAAINTRFSQFTSGKELPETERESPRPTGEIPEIPPEEQAEPEISEPEEPVQAADEEEIPEAVAAFLESQAEFSGYAIPANVTYNVPELPFEYSAPVMGYNSSGFGYRLHPLEGEVKFHFGTDYAAYAGTPILAFGSGTVISAGESESYGLYIIMSHEGGYKTLYAHCSELIATEGQYLEKGAEIALVGATGKVTGAHLHFELMSGENYLNPEFYV